MQNEIPGWLNQETTLLSTRERTEGVRVAELRVLAHRKGASHEWFVIAYSVIKERPRHKVYDRVIILARRQPSGFISSIFIQPCDLADVADLLDAAADVAETSEAA